MQQASEKPGRGFLFRNRDKLNESSPDFRGKALAEDGTPLSVAAWEHPHGISVSVREWKEKPEEEGQEIERE